MPAEVAQVRSARRRGTIDKSTQILRDVIDTALRDCPGLEQTRRATLRIWNTADYFSVQAPDRARDRPWIRR